jgi:2-oxoglutarate dehydrogenase E2 component (dihydrolipoamide succinyltransferase)
VQLLANEGDTVEPGNKIAIISRSADATTHVAPSENAHEKPAPKPTPKASEPEKKTPKVETEKPKAHTPPSSPSEPQLPPKDRESRVSHCDCYSFVNYVYQLFFILMSAFIFKVPMTRLWKQVATRLNDAQNTLC